jgi:hypothetical protein
MDGLLTGARRLNVTMLTNIVRVDLSRKAAALQLDDFTELVKLPALSYPMTRHVAKSVG